MAKSNSDMLRKKIKSPCQLICTYDTDHICVGCFRSAEEVAQWDSYTEDQKRQVIDNTMKRRQESGQSYYGFGG